MTIMNVTRKSRTTTGARTTAPARGTSRRLVEFDPTRFDPAQGLDADILTKLGFQVDLDGIEAHEDAARVLVDAARVRGIRPVLVEVLSDPSEPSVARTRAFGHLAYALSN